MKMGTQLRSLQRRGWQGLPLHHAAAQQIRLETGLHEEETCSFLRCLAATLLLLLGCAEGKCTAFGRLPSAGTDQLLPKQVCL